MLKNNKYDRCLKLEGGPRNFIIGSNCTKRPPPDMSWIRIPTVNEQFMNIETLTCLGRNRTNGDKVTLWQCRNTNANWQKIECSKNQTGIKIAWKVYRMTNFLHRRFLYLQRGDEYAISSTKGSDQLWNNSKTYCKTSSSYKGI